MSEIVKQGYKKTEVGIIPEEWSIYELNDIGDTLIGLTYSPREVNSDGILVLRSSNIQNGRLDFSNNVYVKRSISPNIMVQNNDILICVRNGSRDLIGKSVILDDRTKGMSFGAFMSVFRSPYSSFLANFFKSYIFYKQVHEHLGATINQITNKSLNSFLVALPPLGEQQAITSVLADVDALLDSLEELLTKKRQLKQAAMQELLTGKTRLEGFEGEWETQTLLEMANFSKANFDDGDWVEAEYLTETGVRLIQTGNIGVGKFNEKDNKKYISNESYTKLRCKEIYPGDLLICRLAAPAGRACILPNIEEDKIIVSVDVTIFRPDITIALHSYLNQIMAQENWLQEVAEHCGGTTHSRISRSALGELSVAIPPLKEQKAIAAILSEMDAELEALEERVSKTRDLKQGMMQELLTGRTRLV